MLRILAIAIAGILIAGGAANADTLDRIRESSTLKLGYRADAPPYSYKSQIGEPAGYTVDLCRAVAAHIKADGGLGDLSVEYVQVTVEDRFDAIKTGRIDVLCGADTATLSRREIVDFSIPTFVDGAGVLLRADGPSSFAELNGKKVGVGTGTTTEEALRNTVRRLGIEIEMVTVKDHGEGIAKLLNGELSAYFADRGILLYQWAGSGAPDKLRLADQQFTYEPYALALPLGDGAFRLAVDRALSRIYRSGEINKIFSGAFGPKIVPTPELLSLYRVSALPE
jgi:ABC-type amino acid transport substrate-binding protein